MANRFEMLNDNIGVFHKAVSANWCNKVIKLFDDKVASVEHERTSAPMETLHGVTFLQTDNRTDVSLEMDQFGSFGAMEHTLKRTIEECYTQYWEQVNGRFTGIYSPWNCIQRVVCKIQRSPAGGGFTRTHHEQSNTKQCSKRFAVWMLYLNDVYKGGATQFPNQDIEIHPRTGTMVFFPASYTHPHRSSPDLDEFKYIITGWLVYKDKDDPDDNTPPEVHRV